MRVLGEKLRNYDVVKSNSPCILLNKNVNETESKIVLGDIQKVLRSGFSSIDPPPPSCLPLSIFELFKHALPLPSRGTFVLARTHPLTFSFYSCGI